MVTFDDIINDFNEKYNTYVIDVSKYFNNGDKWLYNIVKSIYKESYDPHERIIFYFPKDKYPYNNNVGQLVSSLQQHIASFDISHFFIKIITEDELVDTSIEKCHKLYGIDSHIIECIIASYVPGDHPKDDLLNPKDTICSLLWDEFYVSASSEVFPCCYVDRGKSFADMNASSWVDVLNSEKFRKLRVKMLNGEKDEACRDCYKIEKSNTYSLRMKANKVYDGIDIVSLMKGRTDANGGIISPPSRLTFGFRNTCNLKCVMCTGRSSSMIQKEEYELLGKTFNVNDDLQNIDRKKRMDIILPVVKHLDYIIFAAGEPLLIKEHYDILDELIKLDMLDIRIEYYTNMTMKTYKDKNIYDYWRQFSNLNLYFSVDGMHKRGEYVRYGINWTDLEKNYDEVIRLLPNANVEFASTIHLYNAFDLINFHQSWITNKKILPSKLQVKAVVSPSFMTIQVLPQKYKELLDKKINDHIQLLNTYPDSSNIIYLWDCVLKTLWEADNSHLIGQLFEHTDKIDNHRNMFFDETFPEYADLRSYI